MAIFLDAESRARLIALLPPRHATRCYSPLPHCYDHLTLAFAPSKNLIKRLLPWAGTAAELHLGEEASSRQIWPISFDHASARADSP